MFAKIVQWSIAKTEGGEVPGPLTMRKTARLVPFPSLSNLFSERERECVCVRVCVWTVLVHGLGEVTLQLHLKFHEAQGHLFRQGSGACCSSDYPTKTLDQSSDINLERWVDVPQVMDCHILNC